ncbi:hypothetical protein [Hymenobacter norwichensis]|uniref:hypothetical protein n=1 Tax=Hymenobacter norwichensis TaxID=223903 RepID=UPI0003B35A36|nr:hypothetical protein [Hymenobacter norwichensis]
MKKILVASALALGTLSATYAQTPEGIPATNKRTEEYCQLKARQKINGRYVVSIDYGQQQKLVSENLFRDASGKAVEFRSAIDALNWLNGQGWELMSTFVLVEDGDGVAYYVLRRRIQA